MWIRLDCVLMCLRRLIVPLVAIMLSPPSAMNFLHGPTVERAQRPGTILQSYIVRSDIHYRYAITFISSEVINPTGWRQRVNFTVILPENAYISSFVMEVGGQLYETTVTERMQPDVTFADGHLNEIEAVRLRDSNIFRASVCLAGEGTIARFYLTYEELLQRRMGAYHHVINLHPEQVAQEMKVEVHIREGRNITALRVPNLQSGQEIDPITSLSDDNLLVHVMKVSPSEALITLNPTPEEQQQWRGQWNVTKLQKEKLAAREGGIHAERGLEGQLVVLYDVARDPFPSPESGGELVIKDGYFVHFFSPDNLSSFDRHLVLVIDVSKSMNGRKMRGIKNALIEMLDSLKKTEYFSIIKFNSSKSVWSPLPKVRKSQKYSVIPATPKFIKKAKKHLKKLDSSGGTKTIQGLMKGLSVAKKSRGIAGNHTIFPMIVLVTDGETDAQSSEEETKRMKGEQKAPTNKTEKNNLGRNWEIPVFSLGFVPDSDMPLLRAISRRSAGGWARRIYLASDIGIQISELHAEAAWPVLGGVRFYYCRNLGGLEVDPSSLTQTRFYSTVSGSELVVAGKLKNYDEELVMHSHHEVNAELFNCSNSNRMLSGIVTATSAKGRKRFPFRSTVADSSFPIERLWAYLMVSQLTELEAAQKAWGPYWTEGILNGGFFLRENNNDTQEMNWSHTTTFDGERKSSAKILAKKYSFVSPGMILMFAELRDDAYIPWEYKYMHNIDNERFERRPSHEAQRNRMRPSHGVETSQQMGRLNFDQERSGGCNDQKQGLFWIPLPHELRPASLCSIGVHNNSCTTTNATENDGVVEKYPLVKSLEELTWLKDVKRGSHILLPKGIRDSERQYKLGLGQEDKQYGRCRTPAGVPGHCRHLYFCLLKDFATDLNYFLKFFCHIEGESIDYANRCSTTLWSYYSQLMIPSTSELNHTMSPEEEINAYLAETLLPQSADIFKYWKDKDKYKKLRKLSRKFLITPIPTLSSERLFITSGIIVDKKPSILDPERVRC